MNVAVVVVLLTCIVRIWWTRYILSLIFPVVCRKKKISRREEMKWGKNTRLSTALGRELLWPSAYSVLGVVVAVAAAVAATHCYLYTIRILYNTICALHILATNTFIRRNAHSIPTATIIRAVYTRVRTAYTAVGAAASAAQIESPIHMQLTSCSAFFSFFISVHFARAAFTFASTAAPSRIIQKLDGVARTIKSTIALHWVGIAKRIG